MPEELACLDGVVAPSSETFVPATDEGLLRGDGVFEVMRVYDGRIFAMQEHLDRMERSAARSMLGWDVPRSELEEEAPALVEQRGGANFDGIVRLVLTRSGRRLVLTEPVPPGPERSRLAFVTYSPTRVLDGVKTLSYGANMLASRMARDRGFDEALLVTPHGRVLEAPTSSIFWAGEDGTLSTPPLDEHILASITRDLVLKLVGVREAPLTKEELLAAREAFLCSTTREVQPVGAVEDTDFGEPGERTLEARAALREHISGVLG
ncbi:MAG TPA: aminotransferase class IV [Thermoleophilaceae bacterium]|nr:aminotransferase class IV [Thermoleophilaceae bacterium]